MTESNLPGTLFEKVWQIHKLRPVGLSLLALSRIPERADLRIPRGRFDTTSGNWYAP